MLLASFYTCVLILQTPWKMLPSKHSSLLGRGNCPSYCREVCSLETSRTVPTAEACIYILLWGDAITIWLFSRTHAGMVCQHFHPESHRRPHAGSGMTKGIISWVVFDQISRLCCSFQLPWCFTCLHYMHVRSCIRSKRELADPVLHFSNPWHHLQQANGQHQLKEKKGQRLWGGVFSSPFTLWQKKKNQRNASQTDALERGRKLA